MATEAEAAKVSPEAAGAKAVAAGTCPVSPADSPSEAAAVASADKASGGTFYIGDDSPSEASTRAAASERDPMIWTDETEDDEAGFWTSAGTTEASDSAPVPERSSSAVAGFWSSASRFGRQATALGQKARRAIVEEARNVAEDAIDVAHGVREGALMTAKDTQEATKALSDVLGDRIAAREGNSPWASVFGGRRRDCAEGTASDATASTASSTGAADSSEAKAIVPAAPQEGEGEEGATAAEPGGAGLFSEALRRNLAATAEASREVLRDLREVNQDVVNEIRTAWRDRAAPGQPQLVTAPIPGPSGEEAEAAQGYAEESPSESSASETAAEERRYDEQAARAAERVRAAASGAAQLSEQLWRKTAGGLRQSLRAASNLGLVQEQRCQAVTPLGAEEFYFSVACPSTRANYVGEIVPAACAASSEPDAPSPAVGPGADAEMEEVAATAATVDTVRRLGGKLRGSLRRMRKEVSEELKHQARDFGGAVAGAAQRRRTSGDDGGASKAGDGAVGGDGEDMFEIGGSDDDIFGDGADLDDDEDPFVASGVPQQTPVAPSGTPAPQPPSLAGEPPPPSPQGQPLSPAEAFLDL